MSNKPKKKIKRPQRTTNSPEMIARRIERHGITLHDLEVAEKKQYEIGFLQGKEFVLKDCYAAAALAYKDMVEGATSDDVTEFLRKLDDYVTYSLTTEELMDKALEEAGVVLQFKEAMSEDRVISAQ